MHFTWQAQWDLLRPGDGAERRKMEFHLLNANPFSITQKKPLSVCLCVSVSVFALKERDCSKMQSNLWTNEKKKLLHPKFGSTIHLVSRVKSLCVLLDVVIRKGIPSVFKTESGKIYILFERYLKVWMFYECNRRLAPGQAEYPRMDLIEADTGSESLLDKHL